MGQSDFKPRKIPDSVKTNPKDLFKQRIETRDQQLKVDKKIETTFKPSTFNNFDNNNTSNKSFDASLLFKKGGPSAGSGNKSFFRGGGGNSFWKKKSYLNNSRASNGEKLIYVELVGQNTIAVKFDGFFDQEIKDKVKASPDAKYEPTSREWLLRKD